MDLNLISEEGLRCFGTTVGNVYLEEYFNILKNCRCCNSLDNSFSIILVQVTFWVRSMVSEAQSFEYFKPMWKLNQSLKLIRFKFKL